MSDTSEKEDFLSIFPNGQLTLQKNQKNKYVFT